MDKSTPTAAADGRTERAVLLDQSEPVDGERTWAEIAEESVDDLNRDAAWIEVQLLGEKQKVEHQGMWSKWLLGLIAFITISDIAIVFMLGLKWISFSSPGVVIPSFIAANLAETYGLGKLVVKFLFRDVPEEPDS
jgi:hypothetical protein